MYYICRTSQFLIKLKEVFNMENYYEIPKGMKIVNSDASDLLFVEKELIVPQGIVCYFDDISIDDIQLIKINNHKLF